MGEVVKLGGKLITLVFPIDGPRPGGPPYSVSVDMVEEVLAGGWKKDFDEEPKESSPYNLGRERLAVWERI